MTSIFTPHINKLLYHTSSFKFPTWINESREILQTFVCDFLHHDIESRVTGVYRGCVHSAREKQER